MSDTYLRSPIIKDLVFPGLEDSSSQSNNTSSSSSDAEYSSPQISDVIFPTLQIARETISTTLDTRSKQILGSYTFGEMGAIQIGKYELGVSGDIRIVPDGFVARNTAGENTVFIDGQTGDIAIKGTLLAGSVIAAEINATQITGQLVNAQIANIAYAKITDVLVTSAQIESLTADKISAGTINASVINVTQLNASNLASGDVPSARMSTNFLAAATASISVLSAITANIGAITAGSITGVSVASSAGSNKVVLDSGDYLRFYVGGTLRASLRGVTATRATGIVLDGDIVIDNNKSYMIKSTTGSTTEYGGVSITNANQFWITLGTANQFRILNNAQNDDYFTVSNNQVFANRPFAVNGAVTCKELILNYGQNEGNIRNVDQIHGYNDLRLYGEGGKIRIEDNNIDMMNHNIDGGNVSYFVNHVNTSDRRLKKHIEKYSVDWNQLLKLDPVKFDWKKASKSNGSRNYGLIAQEVQKVFPEVIYEDADNYLGVSYMELVPILLSAIKDLYKLVNERKLN